MTTEETKTEEVKAEYIAAVWSEEHNELQLMWNSDTDAQIRSLREDYANAIDEFNSACSEANNKFEYLWYEVDEALGDVRIAASKISKFRKAVEEEAEKAQKDDEIGKKYRKAIFKDFSVEYKSAEKALALFQYTVQDAEYFSTDVDDIYIPDLDEPFTEHCYDQCVDMPSEWPSVKTEKVTREILELMAKLEDIILSTPEVGAVLLECVKNAHKKHAEKSGNSSDSLGYGGATL